MEYPFAFISKAAGDLGRLFCRHLRLILAVVAMALAITAILAPVLESLGWKLLPRLIYGFDSALCHQIPGRCLHISGYPVAVCARCFGGYVGFAAASLLFTARREFIPATRLIFGLAGLLGLADAALQFAQVYDSGNLLRLASGAALGFGSGMPVFLFISAIEKSHNS
ncbi:MAG: DUF2085 domain-containing protein [candidate division Zixibacteria bacterium]|nr:DUF2085 domain-containing protein [candidate division Zixibacteria bacterium]MBU1469835.1 DUF2085 domain-containing protein [candidate division Zixibacteria bacterium]MBU2626646.1 DUF2085 domain-containing protein [candidate division Zixibacteria bacterium]